MAKPDQTCRTCSNWFKDGLSGSDLTLLKASGMSGAGACKEGPVTVAKGPMDWCRRWVERAA